MTRKMLKHFKVKMRKKLAIEDVNLDLWYQKVK